MSRSVIFAMIVTLTLGAASTSRAGGTFVETFEEGNEGGWTFGGGDSIPANGGNPDAYLQSGLLDTFAPQPRTTATGSVFTGDFRANAVTAFGVDLTTFSAQTTGGRPLTLMLIHDNGTPGNITDDTAAYQLGPNIPAVGTGWTEYDYVVPSQETALPAGWLLLNLGDSGAPANHTWDQVIQDVNRVQFFYGDPTFFFIFQQWLLGLDNPRITTEACGAGAGAVPDGADVPGTMLTIRKTAGENIRLFWGHSCNSCDSTYGVYEGTLGQFDSHTPLTCSTGGAPAMVVSPGPGNVYYLVVPSNEIDEGSHGRATGMLERDPGPNPCFPQQFEGCQ